MNDIISAAESLPVRERALIVDSILKPSTNLILM